jgi:DNA-binding PadR family transcriptional regulator
MVSALGEATPYDMKMLAARSLDHFRTVRHAQLYSEPERLAGAGYLDLRQEETGRQRRLYSVTPKGQDALQAWLAVPAAAMTEIRDEAVLKIFFGADPAQAAKLQIGLHEGRLEEFEDTLEKFGPQMSAGQRLSLRIGMRYERDWLGVLRDVESGNLHGEP